MRYVKRTLRIVPFVPLRRAALYRHIAAVGYAGFNGFAAAIGYQRINWIFPGRIPHSVYFKLRSEQGLAVFIGLLYRQRAGLGRIFNRHSVASARCYLEGYRLLVQLIALRRRRLFQVVFAQRQLYFTGAAVCSCYLAPYYRILILIQNLKYRAAQRFAASGVYLFNGKLLLHRIIRPEVGGVAYGYAVRRCAADIHIVFLIAALIAFGRYYLRKLIHAIRHVFEAHKAVVIRHGIHLFMDRIRRTASLYKLQLEHRARKAIARAVGFLELYISLFAPVFKLQLYRLVMTVGVHRNHFVFYTHYALRDVCFTEIIRAPEQPANEYLATFICNELCAGIRKAGIGIPAVTSSRRNKPACAVFQRKLYSFQQLAVFVSLDYFQACIYLRVIYANPCFVIFNLEVLARRYDDITFRRLYFFQKVFAQGKVFEGKGAVTAGSKYSRIIFIGKGNEVCSVGRYILLLGVPDYKLRAGKLCISVFGKLCDDKLGMFVFYGFKLYNSLRTIRTVNRHLYRGCLNIPLRCFDLGNCILSKRKPCKRHHTILPAFSRHRDDVSAADRKLNAREQFPIVALLDERQRVFFQCILYFRFYVPGSVSAYRERPYGFIQRISIGRSNFLNIIRSGLQVCKQRLAVFAGRLDNLCCVSVLIKPEHRALQRLICASGLGYAYAALIAGVSPVDSNVASFNFNIFSGCNCFSFTAGIYLYMYTADKPAIVGWPLSLAYIIVPSR